MTSSDKTRDAAPALSAASSTTPPAAPKYTTKERNCKTVPLPPAHDLDIADLFSNPSNPDEKPNLEILKQHLLLEGRLTEPAALRIIEAGRSFSPCHHSITPIVSLSIVIGVDETIRSVRSVPCQENSVGCI